MSCISCRIVDPINSIAEQYAYQLFDLLAGYSIPLFNSFFGLWFIYQIVNKGIIKANLNFEDFVKSLCLYSIVLMLLQHHNLFWTWFYTPFNQTMQLLLIAILKLGINGDNISSTQGGLLEVIDKSVEQIYVLTNLFWKEGSFWNIGLIIGGIFLIIPYLVLWGIFIAFLLEYTLKLLLVSAITPFLLIAFAFPSTRSFTFGGLKIILQSSLTLIFSVITMSFTLVVIRRIFIGLPITGQTLKSSAALWVFSADYWSCILIALISVHFLLKTHAIAANIIGSVGNTGIATSIVAGSSNVYDDSKNALAKLPKAASDAFNKFK